MSEMTKGGQRVDLPVEDVAKFYEGLGFGTDWQPFENGSDGFVAQTPKGRIGLSAATWEFGGYLLQVWVDGECVLSLDGFGSLDLPFCEAVSIPNAPTVLSDCGYEPRKFVKAYDAAIARGLKEVK